VNRTRFRTNLSYLSYISNVILNAFLQHPTLSSFQIEIVPEKDSEVINCVASFLNFINGNPFSLDGFSSEIFFHVVDKLEIIGFEDILLQLYSIPTTFKEATNFLQFSFASSLKTHFHQSIEIVSSKFFKFNLEQLPPFTLSVFESILFSLKLKILDETTLLQIILAKMKVDSNYKCLIKHVHFAFVKSEVLIDFFPRLN
jgi:hypothetical protein